MKIFIDFSLLLFGKFKFFIFLLLIVFLLSDSKKSITLFFKAYNFNISDAYIEKSDFQKLLNSQERIKLLKYVNEKIDFDAIFLLFRDADFLLYTNKKFIRHLDPILVNVYKSENDQVLYQYLKYLNISYMYIPSYTSAIRSNTVFLSFINNPNYTELVTENAGYRIYKIKQVIGNEKYNLTKHFVVKNGLLFKSSSKYAEYQTRLYSPKIDIDIDRKYQVKSLFSGTGYLRVVANESDANGTEFSSRTLDTHLVDQANNETLINKTLYIPSKRAKKVKFVYVPSKDSSVKVLNTKIYFAKEEEVPVKPENITLKNKMNGYLNTKIKVKSNTEYYIKSDIIGDNLLTLYVQEYDVSGKNINTSYLNSVMCSDEIKHFSAIYMPSEKTDYFKLFYRKKAKSTINIYNHTIYDVNKQTKGKNVKQ